MRTLTMDDVMDAARNLSQEIMRNERPHFSGRTFYGVPRGGIAAALAVARCCDGYVVDDLAKAEVVIDDLVDTGATRNKFLGKPFGALFTKQALVPELGTGADYYAGSRVPADEWLVFPWEASEVGSATDIPTRLLQFIGEDPNRPGLKDTPERFIKAWKEWSNGYAKDPKNVLKTFEDGAERVDEMVVVRDIPVYSHCEHHLAPFFGVAHVAYVPSGKIVGLSKIPRLVNVFAHRLQVQERLTNQIADALVEHLKPVGVGVMIECRHLCMESRGIRQAGSSTVTSAMRGVLMTKPEARAELMALVRRT